MEKLMKPVEYAQELGISRQAVYAKIKRGILTAKNVDGKLYIVVDKPADDMPSSVNEETTKSKKTAAPKTNNRVSQAPSKDYESLLAAKEETISVLKGTVKDLKKSNKQISTTLKGEIDLLKEAFHEMRNLYVLQIEHQQQEAIEVIEEESVEVVEERWITIKKFFKKLGVKKEKQQEKIMRTLKKAHKSGDDRLIKEDGKLKVNINKNYEDILK